MLAQWQAFNYQLNSLSCLFPLGCREGPGERGRVGPGGWRGLWHWSLCSSGLGRGQEENGRTGADKGDGCNFLAQVLLITCLPQGSWLPSPVPTMWPTGPRIALSPLCPHANSSCALLLRLERTELLAEAQTSHPWVASQHHFFISVG